MRLFKHYQLRGLRRPYKPIENAGESHAVEASHARLERHRESLCRAWLGTTLLRFSRLTLALLADVGHFVFGDLVAGFQRQRFFVSGLGCVQLAQFNQGIAGSA